MESARRPPLNRGGSRRRAENDVHRLVAVALARAVGLVPRRVGCPRSLGGFRGAAGLGRGGGACRRGRRGRAAERADGSREHGLVACGRLGAQAVGPAERGDGAHVQRERRLVEHPELRIDDGAAGAVVTVAVLGPEEKAVANRVTQLDGLVTRRILAPPLGPDGARPPPRPAAGAVR
eukprot:scaffold9560_cov98-Isochrysis_galbana.AAC.1